MTRSQFFQHFDLLADQPDAVAKMRELVLQLAVRGQLVEQNSKDEPAQKTVERARQAWPEWKVRERLKAERQAPPHPLPSAWAWTCLDEIGDTNPRNEADDKLEVGFAPMKLISAGYGEPVSFEAKRWAEVKKGFTHFADGDVVLAKITPCFENGKSAVIRNANNGIGAGTTELHVFRQYSGCVLPDYVLIFLKSPRFISDGFPRMTGSAGQKRVPWDYFANTPFPLPPLAEQRRIVAKVEELMALCDELAARQQARHAVRAQLQQSALHHLLAARDPHTFAPAWQRVRDQFHLLHDTPDALPQLRQAILQLAVQGRLVPQNPKDESAADSLRKVAKEKKRLSEAGQGGRAWQFKPIGEEEIAFAPPQGWQWAHIIDTAERVTVGYVGPMKNEYVSAGIPFLRSQNVRENRFRPDGLLAVSREFHQKIIKSALAPRDVVVVRSGNVGTACVIPDTLPEANCSDLVVIKRPLALDPLFLSFYLNSLAKAHVEEGKVGVALTHFNTESVAGIPICVPPLAEQKRIVARVEALLRQCDVLAAQLHQTRTLGAHLLNSTLHHLLAA